MAAPTKTDWALMERVISHARRTLLYGPPGTGKTTVAMTLAQADADDDTEVEIFRVSLHDEMTVAELIGHFVPVGDRFVWLDGPAMAAWRNGARLVLDEIDLASGAILSIARALLDDERVARLSIPNAALAGLSDEELAAAILNGDGLETIRPTEGYQVVATMNGEPEDLDPPLLERFDARFYVGVPHPNAIKALPRELRATAERTALEENPQRRISVRTWHNFVNLARKVGADDAAFAVFGARADDVISGLGISRVDLRDLFRAGGKPETVGPATADVASESAAAAADPSVAAREKGLARLNRKELRDMARRRGMPQGPNKRALVRRLALAGVEPR